MPASFSPCPRVPRRRVQGGGLFLAALLLVGRAAGAQDASPEPSETPAPASSEPVDPSAPATPGPVPTLDSPDDAVPPAVGEEGLVIPTSVGEVVVGGRLDVRETLVHPEGGIWAGELTVPAARIELGYRWKKRLRAVMEFDVRGDIKDAFIWLKIGKGLSTRAGRFKVPLSLVELESATRLPVVRRGLLRDVLNDALGLTGRSPGAQLEWKCSRCTHELKVQAGVWQTHDPDSKVALERGLGLLPAIRGTWELGSVEVGASALYQPKGSSPGGDESSWVAGVDARHTLELGTGALRTWAEALTGRLALVGGTRNSFLGRAVSAWRWGGRKDGKPYVEPFLMVSGMDPDLDSPEDLLWEGALGLNAGQWRRWRVQAQFEVRKAGAGVPPVLEALEESLASRRALTVQLEVGF